MTRNGSKDAESRNCKDVPFWGYKMKNVCQSQNCRLVFNFSRQANSSHTHTHTHLLTKYHMRGHFGSVNCRGIFLFTRFLATCCCTQTTCTHRHMQTSTLCTPSVIIGNCHLPHVGSGVERIDPLRFPADVIKGD